MLDNREFLAFDCNQERKSISLFKKTPFLSHLKHTKRLKVRLLGKLGGTAGLARPNFSGIFLFF